MGNCRSLTEVNTLSSLPKIDKSEASLSHSNSNLEKLVNSLSYDSMNGETYNQIGKIYFELDNYKDAEYYLCKAVSLNKGDFFTYYYLGIIINIIKINLHLFSIILLLHF